MKKYFENRKGITLVALVITIIILLILATISIQSLTNTGLFKNAQKAKEESEKAQRNEQEILGQYMDALNKQTSDEKFEKTRGVNKPELMQGMKAIKFTDPLGDTEGTVQQVSDSTSTDWYDYNSKKWANAQTQDGSMWVWIPRYAYKVVYNDSNDKTKGGKFDVVFLIGTTDDYYENGVRKTAKRQTKTDETVDTTTGYTVHPAFTNESSIGYANGGWNQELTGIWVAKFEAGYATSNGNSAPKKASSVNYSQTSVWASGYETGTGDGTASARNITIKEEPSKELKKYVQMKGFAHKAGSSIRSKKSNTVKVKEIKNKKVFLDKIEAGDSVELIYTAKVKKDIPSIKFLKNEVSLEGKNKDGSDIPITPKMNDYDKVNLKENNKPMKKNKDQGTPGAKTGDNNTIAVYLLVGLLSLSMIFIILYFQKRKKDNI